MVIPTINFISYNLNGLNSIKAEWIRNLYKVSKSYFIYLKNNFQKKIVVDLRMLYPRCMTTSRILWLNKYFPIDQGGVHFNEEELHGLLSDNDSIMDGVDFDDIVWNGDRVAKKNFSFLTHGLSNLLIFIDFVMNLKLKK